MNFLDCWIGQGLLLICDLNQVLIILISSLNIFLIMLRRRMEVRSHRIVNWHLILNKICRLCLIRSIFSLHVLKKLTSETRISKAIVDDLSLSHFLHIFKPIID